MGISPNTVSGLLGSARRQRRSKPAERHGKTILFPDDVLDRLRPHAERRGISCNELARRLVETSIEEGMIDAVLDDLEDSSCS